MAGIPLPTITVHQWCEPRPTSGSVPGLLRRASLDRRPTLGHKDIAKDQEKLGPRHSVSIDKDKKDLKGHILAQLEKDQVNLNGRCPVVLDEVREGRSDRSSATLNTERPDQGDRHPGVTVPACRPTDGTAARSRRHSSGTKTRNAEQNLSEEDEEDDLEDVKPKKRRDYDSACMYTSACKRLHVLPASQVEKALKSKQVNVSYKSMTPAEIKAICIALVNNASVMRVDMKGNAVGGKGASYVCEMLQENVYISDMNLSETNMGSVGAKLLRHALAVNRSVKRIDVSGNGFKDSDAIHFTKILAENNTLKDLNLSHNEFGEKGGIILGTGIENTATLQTLDLSWNHLRLKGAAAVCKSLAENDSIKELNLEMNGISQDGCAQLHKSLAANSTLETLNISSNRINGIGLSMLTDGLRKNSSLLVLSVGNNPIPSFAAIELLKMIKENKKCKLRQIDMMDVNVSDEFEKELKDLELLHHVEVNYGTRYRQSEIYNDVDDSYLDYHDPLLILFEYMRHDNLRMRDLLHKFDVDNSGTISREEVKKGLLKVNIPLTENSIDKLMRQLDLDGDGEVDLNELTSGRRQTAYKLKKIKKASKEEEELRKLRILLRDLMQNKPTATPLENKSKKEANKKTEVEPPTLQLPTNEHADDVDSDDLDDMPTYHRPRRLSRLLSRKASILSITFEITASSIGN